MSTERVPKAWGSLVIAMLQKKENSNNPENYRPITLVNCKTKLFTNVLRERLISWMNVTGFIPE